MLGEAGGCLEVRVSRSSGTCFRSTSACSSRTSGAAASSSPLATTSARRVAREAVEGKESICAIRFVFSCSRSYSSKLRSRTGDEGGTDSAASTARDASAVSSASEGAALSDLAVAYERVSE